MRFFVAVALFGLVCAAMAEKKMFDDDEVEAEAEEAVHEIEDAGFDDVTKKAGTEMIKCMKEAKKDGFKHDGLLACKDKAFAGLSAEQEASALEALGKLGRNKMENNA